MFDVALVGAGRIGNIHAANIARHRRLRLAHVVDRNPARARDLAAPHHARASTLETALADPQVAGIVVASETGAHLEQTLAAVAAGKAVLCEKPLDLELARARQAEPALAGGRVLLGFNRRFDPHVAALRERLLDGAIGELEAVQITSHDPAPPTPAYVQGSGGLFKDMTIHDLDMARWLLGEEPVAVYAAASCLVDPAIGRAGDVDTARLVLRTASGRLCTISNSRRSGYGYDQRIELFGAAGALRMANVHTTEVSQLGAGGEMRTPVKSFFLDRYADAFAREVDHFAAIVAGEIQPSCTVVDGIAALALAEAAAQSAASGREVRPC